MGSTSASLFEWVGTLSPFSASTRPHPEDFREGGIITVILKKSIDPIAFHDLKSSPSLECTPIVQVLKRMKEYLHDQIGHPIPTRLCPNIRGILSGDVNEISRLLQLLLGCAVNCPRKEEFINNILKMEQTVQTVLKTSIEELMRAPEEDHVASDVVEMQLKKSRDEIGALLLAKDSLSQQCHDLHTAMSQMKLEKAALMTENERLQAQLAGHFNNPESIHMSMRIQEENRKEIELLRERNFELEALVDDYKVKNQVLEKQIGETHVKMASAATAEEEVVRLKDEMDSLREAAAKAAHYEKQCKTWQKKLEEMADFKQNLKLLEEKNVELYTANFNLTEENKKIGNYKQQLDALKKDLTELQQRLSQETQKALKANFDCNKMREKLETAQGQIQTLQEEKTRMSDMMEELRLVGGGVPDGLSNFTGNASVDSIELLPPLIRQKLVRLELENKKLQDELKAVIDSDPSHEGSKVLVEQLRKHEEELEKELLAKTQETFDIRASYEEKIKLLANELVSKEEDLKKKENQYKKCMEKAKSVIVTLEPTATGLDPTKTEELEKVRAIREMEEKLLASAFYQYGLNMHRNAVETRNTTLLQRQRLNVNARRKNEL